MDHIINSEALLNPFNLLYEEIAMNNSQVLPKGKEARDIKLKQLLSAKNVYIQNLERSILNLNLDEPVKLIHDIQNMRLYVNNHKIELFKANHSNTIEKMATEFLESWNTLEEINDPDINDIARWLNGNWSFIGIDICMPEIVLEKIFELKEFEQAEDDWLHQDRMDQEEKDRHHEGRS